MIKIRELTELNNKFYRFSGWSGADGIYSFKVADKVLLYFSDTFIGDSSKNGIRKDFKLINNSLAVIKNDTIDFYYNKNPISSSFAASNNSYYWLEDGIVEGDKLTIFALKMKNDVLSSLPFEIEGIDIIRTSTTFKDSIEYTIQETNLYSNNIVWGISLIKENDYYYVFGYKNIYNNKCLVLSRTKDFISYEYLNEKTKNQPLFRDDSGESLTCGQAKAKVDAMAAGFEAESKIVKKGNFYYIAYTKDSISSEIFLIRTDSLLKPFTKEIKIYTCPEHQGNIITYNAKIQDALSSRDNFVISYNVNTLVNDEHQYLSIYRPRFIEISIKEIDHEFEKDF